MPLIAVFAGLLLSQTYSHKATTVSEGRTQITVYNRQSGRHMWRRTFEDNAVGWSKDHKAIAILDSDFYITTWQHGQSLRRYKIGPRPGGLGEPPLYRNSIRWSPDKQRILLVVLGTMGDATLAYGMLMVVKVRTGGVEDVELVASERSCDWVDSRKVRYWIQRRGKNDVYTIVGPFTKHVR